MRTYLTTTVEGTKLIFDVGFADIHSFSAFKADGGVVSCEGVYLATRPLDANDGFPGDVVLCLEVPDDLFAEREATDDGQKSCGYRTALIPAAVLNRLGKPQVYDHFYAGHSRRELVRGARRLEGIDERRLADDEGEGWKQSGRGNDREVSAAGRQAKEVREAIEFFDSIGWLTPLKLREAAQG